MARARNIKPSFFTNDQLAEIDPLGRLLFIGLWTIADREGRLEDRPRRIKAELLPYDDIDADMLLDALQEHGFILRYQAGGARYIQILAFAKHQNPHVKEGASTIPAPGKTEEDQGSTRQAPCKPGASPVQDTTQTGTSPADSPFLIPDSPSRIPDPKETPSSGKPDGDPPGFVRFWAAWPRSPRKVAKAECLKRWCKRGLESQAEGIVSHVSAMATSRQWRDGFEPAPLTYLNQSRWLDGEGQEAPPNRPWYVEAGFGDERSAIAAGVRPEATA